VPPLDADPTLYPAELGAMVEAVVAERLASGGLGPEVELGWISRLDGDSAVMVPLRPVRRVLGLLLDSALERTERGSVSIHVERGPGEPVHIELEDSAETLLRALPPALVDLLDRIGASHTVQCEPGVGTMVILTVPVKELPALDEAPCVPAAEVHSPAPINVATDAASPLVVATAESQLRRLGVTLVDQRHCADCALTIRDRSLFRGTELVGSLPMTTAAWHRALVAPGTDAPTVLLVDDNVGNAVVVEGLIRRLGCRVLRAGDGPQALAVVQEHRPSLILMDCEMPGWDGVRTTAEIRRWESQEGLRPIPILATTAHSRDHIWWRFAAVGATDMLRTPLHTDTLRGALRDWVGFTGGAAEAPAEPPASQRQAAVPATSASPLDGLSPDLFDEESLSQVIALGHDEFRHLVKVWSRSVGHLRREIDTGIRQREAGRVRAAAHTLKSSMGSMGLLGLRRIVAQVEQLAAMEALGAADTLLESARADLDRAMEELEAATQTAPAAPVESSFHAPEDRFRVLVVDDDAYTRSIASQTLTQAGCIVDLVDSGEAALDHLSRHQPDMVLLDVEMPGIDGFETCERIREEHSATALPVLIMTGQDDVGSVDHAFRVGASDFMPKPFNPQLLRYRVRFLRRAHLSLLELQDNRSRIRTLAYTDRVTGLPNRAHLIEALETAHAEVAQDPGAPSLAIVFIDLDGFKAVNDTHGHAVGDDLLRAVGNRLHRTLDRQVALSDQIEDFVLARIGGDEFVALLRGPADRDSINRVALPMVEALRRSFTVGEHEVRVGASAGVAAFPENGRTVDALLTNADQAMYRVKRSGGNGLRGSEGDAQAEAITEARLLDDLRVAIREGQLQVFLQSRIDTKHGNVRSAEALVRWNHPTRGLLLPGAFIAEAEQHGLINDLGRVVLNRSLEIVSQLDAEGLRLRRVSVNISAMQLRELDFADEVLAALRTHGVSASRLELEVTETAVIENFNTAVHNLERLRKRGVTIAVDDFGMGHSSLQYLHRLPVDVLKIDRSFIEAMAEPDTESDRGAVAIVSMLVALGGTLGLTVVAEGVETHEQLARLCRLGCDEIQGFLISRPVPVAEFKQLLENPKRLTA
jgi:diguanylate cyclase (GGDEF)-like protein